MMRNEIISITNRKTTVKVNDFFFVLEKKKAEEGKNIHLVACESA